MTVIFDADAKTSRRCGDCQLCCKLLPMKSEHQAKAESLTSTALARGIGMPEAIESFDKPAGARCPYQRHHKGCTVYDKRPLACRFWNCRWLMNADTADLSRPDRTGYVIDAMPDWITADGRTIEVVQIWVDAERPDAWREPKLLAFLERRAREGVAALVRTNHRDATVVFAPPMANDRQWHEITSASCGKEHSHESLIEGLARARGEYECDTNTTFSTPSTDPSQSA